jgi:hypothetical protein
VFGRRDLKKDGVRAQAVVRDAVAAGFGRGETVAAERVNAGSRRLATAGAVTVALDG